MENNKFEKLQKVMEKITYESLKEGAIKETTENELEAVLLELFWKIILNDLYNHTILWLKIMLFLFIVYQILDNIIKYIDSREIRFRSPIYTNGNS